MSDAYTMPPGRTYCGRYRCCREAGHLEHCEEDITYLTGAQLQAIRDSATADRVEVTGNIVVHHPVRPCRVYWGSQGCTLQHGHRGHHNCCCTCEDHVGNQGLRVDEEGEYLCVATWPYYGPDTRFSGEDHVAPEGNPCNDSSTRTTHTT